MWGVDSRDPENPVRLSERGSGVFQDNHYKYSEQLQMILEQLREH